MNTVCTVVQCDCVNLCCHLSAGSGKTLSFGIPMIHTILEWKKTIHCKNSDADGTDAGTEPEMNKTGEQTEDTADNSDGAPEDKKTEDEEGIALEAGNDLVGQSEEDDDAGGSVDNQSGPDGDGSPEEEENLLQPLDIETTVGETEANEKQPLLGLVLTPTRELAVQVKHHIDAVAQFTGWFD